MKIKINLTSGAFLEFTLTQSALDDIVRFISMGHGVYVINDCDNSRTVILNVQTIETVVY